MKLENNSQEIKISIEISISPETKIFIKEIFEAILESQKSTSILDGTTL